MGLVIIAGCFFFPREVGKEDRPIVDVKLDMERLEDMALRVRRAADRRMADRHARIAERRARIAERRAATASSAAQDRLAPALAPGRTAFDASPAMGAAQPLLTDDPSATLTLGNTAENPFGGSSAFG